MLPQYKLEHAKSTPMSKPQKRTSIIKHDTSVSYLASIPRTNERDKIIKYLGSQQGHLNFLSLQSRKTASLSRSKVETSSLFFPLLSSAHDQLKVRKSQKGFHFGSNLQKKVPNYSPEHYSPNEKIPMVMIWHHFLGRFEPK